MRNVNKVKDADGKNVDIPTKLFDEIAPKYKDVKGGYTRIIKKGQHFFRLHLLLCLHFSLFFFLHLILMACLSFFFL